MSDSLPATPLYFLYPCIYCLLESSFGQCKVLEIELYLVLKIGTVANLSHFEYYF